MNHPVRALVFANQTIAPESGGGPCLCVDDGYCKCFPGQPCPCVAPIDYKTRGWSVYDASLFDIVFELQETVSPPKLQRTMISVTEGTRELSGASYTEEVYHNGESTRSTSTENSDFHPVKEHDPAEQYLGLGDWSEN
jgi:hypothetical protein